MFTCFKFFSKSAAFSRILEMALALSSSSSDEPEDEEGREGEDGGLSPSPVSLFFVSLAPISWATDCSVTVPEESKSSASAFGFSGSGTLRLRPRFFG